MQLSSATTSLHLGFWGLRKIVACSQSSSQCLLASTIFGMVSSLHPTSFFILVGLFRYISSNYRLTSTTCSIDTLTSTQDVFCLRACLQSVDDEVRLDSSNDLSRVRVAIFRVRILAAVDSVCPDDAGAGSANDHA